MRSSTKDEPLQIFDRIYIAPSRTLGFEESSRFKFFAIHGVLSYKPFYDDFGPFSLSSIMSFCSIMDAQLSQNPEKGVALKTFPDKRSLTNSVFLMGSYMILKMGLNPLEVDSKFDSLRHRLTTFRDISTGKQNFDLFLLDCWSGLWRAKFLSWVDTEHHHDPNEHVQFGGSLNGSLHEIVPGKFLVMRGPKDLPAGKTWNDVHDGAGRLLHRDFSPAFYLEIFPLFGVQVRPHQHIIKNRTFQSSVPEYSFRLMNSSPWSGRLSSGSTRRSTTRSPSAPAASPSPICRSLTAPCRPPTSWESEPPPAPARGLRAEAP